MLNDATWRYVSQHCDDDVRQLALRGSSDARVDMALALRQIHGRQLARRKLPSWAAIDRIVYPPRLSLEQCSGERAARYKAALAGRLTGEYASAGGGNAAATSLADLTGGFGVDFAYMSQQFDEATYVERDQQLCDIAGANFRLLCHRPVATVCADATDYLHSMDHVSMLFLDPARRDGHGGRTYALADCTPNVVPLVDMMLQKADVVMLKLSPMLDWHQAVQELGVEYVRQVHIVAVDNECKELLVVMRRHGSGCLLVCANDDETFAVDLSRAEVLPPTGCRLPEPSMILCEPNAAVMKGGCFGELAARFGLSPLSANSHLFVSEGCADGFPGRRFEIVAVTTMNKRRLKATLGHLVKANVAVRNFPLGVQELRRRLKIADGGSDYIFATTQANGEHVLLLCQKMLRD